MNRGYYISRRKILRRSNPAPLQETLAGEIFLTFQEEFRHPYHKNRQQHLC